MHKNRSRQLKERTLKSPRYLPTKRRNVCHGANSMTWAKTSLPACIAASRINPESLPQTASFVQIVHTLESHASPATRAFQAATYEIYRTLLTAKYCSFGWNRNSRPSVSRAAATHAISSVIADAMSQCARFQHTIIQRGR